MKISEYLEKYKEILKPIDEIAVKMSAVGTILSIAQELDYELYKHIEKIVDGYMKEMLNKEVKESSELTSKAENN